MIAMRFFPLLCVFPSGLVVVLHVSHWICISSIGSDGIRKQKRRYKWNWWGFELRFYSKRHRGEQNIDKMGIWFVFIVCAWNATSLNKITWAFAFAIIEICLLCASHFNAVAYHYFKSSTPNERTNEWVSELMMMMMERCVYNFAFCTRSLSPYLRFFFRTSPDRNHCDNNQRLSECDHSVSFSISCI